VKKPILISGAAVTAAVFLGAAALALGAYIESEGIRLSKEPIYSPDGRKFSSLPTTFKGWKRVGSDEVIEGETLRELGTDNYLTREFVQSDVPEGVTPKRVSLHLAYYTGTIDTVPHVPERCLVGAGWEKTASSKLVDAALTFTNERGDDVLIRDSYVPSDYGTVYLMRNPTTGRRVRLPLGVENMRMTVSHFRNDSGRVNLFAGYFFVANGVLCPSANDVRANAYGLTSRYAYYAKVQFTSLDVESAEELGELAGSFLDASFHEIMRLLPDWVEVAEGRYPPPEDATP